LQISLAFGATAMMATGSALAAGSNDGGGMTNFRDIFINNVVKGTRVHGRVGIYDFRRWHNLNDSYAPSGQKPNRSTAYGGWLDIHTGMVYGFSAGGEFVYENNFYNPTNGHSWQANPNLVGEGSSNSNISALYLQFNAPGFQVRAGRQLIKTPFASFDRFSFNPRAFDGVTVEAEPLKWLGVNSSPMDSSNNGMGGRAKAPDLSMNAYIGLSPNASNGQTWKLYASKFSKMKARGSGHLANNFFSGSNFYGLTGPNKTSGFWQIGTSYQRNTPNGNYLFQFYHDTFQQVENVEYVEGGYMAPAFGSQNTAAYIKAQYVRADGANNLTSNLRGYGGIKSDIFGLKIGFKSDIVNGAVFANYSPHHNGTLGGGRMLHPYSDLSGYLYTDTMNDGMQEIGPGTAVGASVALKPGYGFGMSSKVSYFHAKDGYGHAFYSIGGKGCPTTNSSVSPGVANNCGSQNSYEVDVGLSYNFGYVNKALTGLKVEDKVGITHFQSGTPKTNFYDNRFRFSYNF